MIFNENDAWKWDIDVNQYPLIIEEEETSSFDSPPDAQLSPTRFTSSESPPRKVRSLVDIYQSCDFVCFASELACFEDAVNEKNWYDAMKVEMNAIEKTKTSRLVDLPPGKEPIGLK